MSPSETDSAAFDPSPHDRESLRALRLADPHRVLGLHAVGNRVVLRAYRPDAVAVIAHFDPGNRVPLEARGEGVFQTTLPTGYAGARYRLEVREPAGQSHAYWDPYSFWPTVGDVDLHLIGEGRHFRLWDKLGAHFISNNGVEGVSFAVWAPNAASLSVVGDFNHWDGRLHLMRSMGASGVWELFIPGLQQGARYKFEIRPQGGGPPFLKADPLAFEAELPPATASVAHGLPPRTWQDAEWMSRRRAAPDQPLAIYEVHLGSWRRVPAEGNRSFTYRELAPALAEHVHKLGFTHVELMPVAEHPFGGSWGYQVSSYFAPTARYGPPEDFRYFVEYLHQRDIGVIVDWVPAHFPKDAHGLARFDGSALYEHADAREGEHPDWGTLVFNYGRNEVRNFLVANALFWFQEYHVDGLRVDAVASMLYRDYSRREGEWIPNRHGGRENEEAIHFLRELNTVVAERVPGAMLIAEESTAWPNVTGAVVHGGLGFSHKWNMGWMNDTLTYFSKDPIYRQHHHHQLTFGLLYAYSERFILPLSHDEVVHGKGSLYGRMPGDDWQKRANLRALLAWMWAHPGKKLVFMGSEFGQRSEWRHDHSLDWHLLDEAGPAGIQQLVQDLNRMLREHAPLRSKDFSSDGFQWLQADAAHDNVYAFVRRDGQGGSLVCAANLSPVPRYDYRIGLPEARAYAEILNTDAEVYGGAGLGNLGGVTAVPTPWDGQPASAVLRLPPLAVVWLA